MKPTTRRDETDVLAEKLRFVRAAKQGATRGIVVADPTAPRRAQRNETPPMRPAPGLPIAHKVAEPTDAETDATVASLKRLRATKGPAPKPPAATATATAATAAVKPVASVAAKPAPKARRGRVNAAAVIGQVLEGINRANSLRSQALARLARKRQGG
jgi:hypothetical protein